jgi:hypothetical protein
MPHPTSRRSILILSFHLCLGLPSDLHPLGFPTKALYAPLLSPIRATCPAHLSLLHFITRMIFGESTEHKALCYAVFSTPLLPHPGMTVTTANYCDMVRNELRPAIRTKWRELHAHDNSCPPTIDTIQQLNWEVLEHPAHSADLAPSDFHLFGPLKDALRGHRFANDDEVKGAEQNWLHNQANISSPPPQ